MGADEKGTEIEEIPPMFELEMTDSSGTYVVRDLAIGIRRSRRASDAHSAGTLRLTAIHHKGT